MTAYTNIWPKVWNCLRNSTAAVIKRFFTVRAPLVNNTWRIHVFFNYGSQQHGTSRFKLVCSIQGLEISIASRTKQPKASSRKQTSIHHCAKLFRKKGTKSKGINIYKSMKPIRVPMRGPGKLTAESTNRSNEVELEDREYPSDCQRSEKARYLIVGLK